MFIIIIHAKALFYKRKNTKYYIVSHIICSTKLQTVAHCICDRLKIHSMWKKKKYILKETTKILKLYFTFGHRVYNKNFENISPQSVCLAFFSLPFFSLCLSLYLSLCVWLIIFCVCSHFHHFIKNHIKFTIK